eukprot:s1902_g3.t1
MVLRPDAGEQADALQTSFGQRLQSFLTQLPDVETRFPEHEDGMAPTNDSSELHPRKCETGAELYRLKKQTSEVLQEITNMKLDLRRKDATILELGRQAGALKSSNAWRSVRRASLVDEAARKSAKIRSFKDWPRIAASRWGHLAHCITMLTTWLKDEARKAADKRCAGRSHNLRWFALHSAQERLLQVSGPANTYDMTFHAACLGLRGHKPLFREPELHLPTPAQAPTSTDKLKA